MNRECLTRRTPTGTPHAGQTLELEHLQRTFSSIYASTPPRPDDLMYKALATRFTDVCTRLYSGLPAPDFRYLGSHAGDLLTQPSSVAAAGEDTLFVTEPKSNRVRVLDGEFRQVRDLEDVFDFPVAASGREDGSAWICDWNNKRLVRLDREAEICRTIDLGSMDSRELPCAHPYAVCRDGKTFFVLVSARDPYEYDLITFREDDPAATLSRLDTGRTGRPIGVTSGRGGLAMVTSLPPSVCGYDFEAGNFTSRRPVFLPGQTRGITAMPDGFLVAGGRYLSVTDHDLRLQSVLDLERATGIEGSIAFTACLRTRNGISSLLVMDKRLGCIHEFGMDSSHGREARDD